MQQEFNEHNESSVNPMQDVIPPGKRSIRNIPIPDRHKRSVEPQAEPIRQIHHTPPTVEQDKEEIYTETSIANPIRRPAPTMRYQDIPDGHFSTVGKSKLPKLIGGVAVALVVVGGIVFASSTFAGADVKIYPHQEAVTVDTTFTAKKNPAQNELGFEVITLSKQESQPATASGEEDVTRKASGTITIYNNYSKDPQKLIKNTRFQTADGRIYRISDAVTVPGQQTVNSKTVPGSVEVQVTADEAGDKYNSTDILDFTIPGFNGDPRYTAFTARAMGPITGGLVGKQPKVSDSDKATAKAKIEATLKDELIRQARAQIPSNYIMYEDGAVMSFEEQPITANGNQVTITEKGVVNAIIFDREKLASYVAQSQKEASGDTSLQDVENLTFALQNKDSFNPSSTNEINFSLKGNAKLVWGYNADKLKEDLSGKSKNDLNTILTAYPSVERAEVVLKPFWRRSFPSDVNQINLENQITTP